MAELPDEVLEQLATHGRARLTIGDDSTLTTDVTVAPLGRQLFLLASRGGDCEARLHADSHVVLHAEDRGGDWSIRATGRAVVGRAVPAEPRRPELMHWLPEGVAPSALVAVRFYPETVEYNRGKGTSRTRAAGPVPGGAPPSAVARWALLATDGVVAWFFVMAALDWVGLLFLVDEEKRRILLLLLQVLAGGLLLGGLTLIQQVARYVRWREGFEADEGALFMRGWEAPGRLLAVGSGMMGLGLLFAGVVSAGAGWRAGGWSVLASAVPLIGPFHLARHLMRRRDAAREKG